MADTLRQTIASVIRRSDPAPNFDTPLDDEQERAFQAWAAEQGRALGRELLGDLRDYDLRGLFKETGSAPLKGGHFTDRYKKPNHPTFSKESIYDGGAYEGGQWMETPNGWVFRASPHNVENLGVDRLREYFSKREPGAKLILPGER